MQAKNLLLLGDFNAPNVNLDDMTTPCHHATFDARILSLCLDNFLVQHSVRATRSVLGQRESCLDLVFTKPSEDILPFDRGQPLGNSDHLSIYLITFVSRALTQLIKGNVTYGRVILKA